MEIGYIILILLVITYFYLNNKETFATSNGTLTQLRSTSTENQINSCVCKDCGGRNIMINYKKRRNYG